MVRIDKNKQQPIRIHNHNLSDLMSKFSLFLKQLILHVENNSNALEITEPYRRMVSHQYFSILNMNGKQFDPPAFDVLIQDLDQKDLHTKISQKLGKPYLHQLQENQKQFQNIRKGIIFGVGIRGLITLPTRNSNAKPIWIHYIIDTASPYTYLTAHALQVLKCNLTSNLFQLHINGSLASSIMMSTNHFSNVNLLGMNFIMQKNLLVYDPINTKIVLYDKENDLLKY